MRLIETKFAFFFYNVIAGNRSEEHGHAKLETSSVSYLSMSIILQVCRGTAVMLVSPTDGTDEIANPFIQPDGA